MELLTSEWFEKSSQTLCELVSALRLLLADSEMQERIQQVMVDNHMLDTIISVIEESVVSAWNFMILSVQWSAVNGCWYRETITHHFKIMHVKLKLLFSFQKFSFEKQMLASECVKTMTSMLIGSSAGKVSLLILGLFLCVFLAAYLVVCKFKPFLDF
jgi:hypothetical protein